MKVIFQNLITSTLLTQFGLWNFLNSSLADATLEH